MPRLAMELKKNEFKKTWFLKNYANSVQPFSPAVVNIQMSDKLYYKDYIDILFKFNIRVLFNNEHGIMLVFFSFFSWLIFSVAAS